MIIGIPKEIKNNEFRVSLTPEGASVLTLKKFTVLVEKDAGKNSNFFSEDYEKENGIPKQAYKFKKELSASLGIIISFAEHNGSYTAAFKNIFDWISRIEKIVWYNKPMFLLSTSDGSRGGISVLKTAYERISRGNPNSIPTFSLPNFHQNFDIESGIINSVLKKEFNSCLSLFTKNLL